MKNNPLIQLEKYGQSVWLDFIRRDLITSGELRTMIKDDGLSGITLNPAIFEKAISESRDKFNKQYDAIMSILEKAKNN
jgi:transaldolase